MSSIETLPECVLLERWTEVLKQRVHTCLQSASEWFGLPFRYDELRVDLRGMSAGQCRQFYERNRIKRQELRFNRALLMRYQQQFVDEVAPHECAHLVAYQQFGRKIRPHGPEWQGIMRDVFDREPRVTHRFEVARPQRAQYVYYCGCEERTHRLSAIRHNRIQRGSTRYICQHCRGELVPLTTAS